MVFADPRFVIAQTIQVLEQLKISLDAEAGVFVQRMEGRQESSTAQVGSHGSCTPSRYRNKDCNWSATAHIIGACRANAKSQHTARPVLRRDRRPSTTPCTSDFAAQRPWR